MRKVTVLLIFGMLAAGVVAGFASTAPESRKVTGSPSTRSIASAVPNATLEVLDPATKQSRGEFTTRSGGKIEIFSGAPSKTLLDVSKRGPGRQCVTAVGADFSAMTCGTQADLLASHVRFLQSWAGGPAIDERTDYIVAGITAPTVTRIEAVITTGAIVSAEITKDHAFLVALSDEQLRAGVTVATLNVYTALGLVRSVDLPT